MFVLNFVIVSGDDLPCSRLYLRRRDDAVTDAIDGTFTTTEERFDEIVTIELKLGGDCADVSIVSPNVPTNS